ncbi:MAG: tRNA adenosine(34) deaminase TadA [Pseudomonadota bacterium]
MRQALELAEKAAAQDEVPIGCVIVLDGEVIGEGHNTREKGADPTAHAEIAAIRQAAKRLGTWRLDGACLVVTCEPCPMCAGAAVQARIARIVFGCEDPKGGGMVSRYGIGMDGELNHTVEVEGGVLAEECSRLLKDFFRGKRTRE